MILYLLVAVVVIAVLVHVGANLYESLRHRENMFKAMVTGEKNAPQRQEPRR
jgi:cytochrome b